MPAIHESVAKTRVCHRKLHLNPGERLCIGSLCMAWQWHGPNPELPARITHNYYGPKSDEIEKEPKKRPEHVPASYKWHAANRVLGLKGRWLEPKEEAVERSYKEQRGYCADAPPLDLDYTRRDEYPENGSS
jgi:hypothetical protein